jgi:hypothetical protein
MKWAGHIAHMRRRGMRIGFWWETQGKRLLGRCRYRWEDNMREVVWTGFIWLKDQWRAPVNTVMNLRVP